MPVSHVTNRSPIDRRGDAAKVSRLRVRRVNATMVVLKCPTSKVFDWIARVGECLVVSFRSPSGLYSFAPFGVNEWRSLVNAKSKGKWWNAWKVRTLPCGVKLEGEIANEIVRCLTE